MSDERLISPGWSSRERTAATTVRAAVTKAASESRSERASDTRIPVMTAAHMAAVSMPPNQNIRRQEAMTAGIPRAGLLLAARAARAPAAKCNPGTAVATPSTDRLRMRLPVSRRFPFLLPDITGWIPRGPIVLPEVLSDVRDDREEAGDLHCTGDGALMSGAVS